MRHFLFNYLISIFAFAVLSSMASAAITEVYGTGHTWPTDDKWIVIPSLNDPHDGSIGEGFDFVGDATNPCAYKYYDQATKYMYFRIRVHIATYTGYNGTIWIYIDYTGDNVVDYAFAWDSAATPISKHGLEMMVKTTNVGPTWSDVRMGDLDGNGADKLTTPGSADFAYSVDATAKDGYIRFVDGQATTNFGTTSFVDFAISNSYLTTNTLLNCNTQTWKIQLGSRDNANDHNAASSDISGANTPASPSSNFSASFPTAVSLVYFKAIAMQDHISIQWKTATELDNAGFHIWKSEIANGKYEKITGFIIPSQGGSTWGSEYSYDDFQVIPGKTYHYQLQDIDYAGKSAFHGPVTVTLE